MLTTAPAPPARPSRARREGTDGEGAPPPAVQRETKRDTWKEKKKGRVGNGKAGHTTDTGRREPGTRRRPRQGRRASRALGPGPHGRPEGARETPPRPPPREAPAAGGCPLSLRESRAWGGTGKPSRARPTSLRAPPPPRPRGRKGDPPGVFKPARRNATARYPDRSGADTRGPEGGGAGRASPPAAPTTPPRATEPPRQRQSRGAAAEGRRAP